MLEVEKKFAISAIGPLIDALGHHGFCLQSDVRHADQYFNHPCKDFAESGEAFRIRRVDGAGLVTYKGPRRSGSAKIRLEDEWQLGGEDESGDRLEALLNTLGFRPQVVVQKRRRTFVPLESEPRVDADGMLSADGILSAGGLSVCVDEVEDLGDFVEIEALVRSESPEATLVATERIENLADRLGLTNVETRSYLTQLIGKRG